MNVKFRRTFADVQANAHQSYNLAMGGRVGIGCDYFTQLQRLDIPIVKIPSHVFLNIYHSALSWIKVRFFIPDRKSKRAFIYAGNPVQNNRTTSHLMCYFLNEPIIQLYELNFEGNSTSKIWPLTMCYSNNAHFPFF